MQCCPMAVESIEMDLLMSCLKYAFVMKRIKVYDLLSFTPVRGYNSLAPETSIWPRLTASTAVNSHIHNLLKINYSAHLRIYDVGFMTWDVETLKIQRK